MAADKSACAQPAWPEDNHERARAYEIAAYLSAASFPFEIADGPPLNPLPSRDLTLNALVQHGVHRMDCDRAFLSLIDHRSQYICAEMTRSQSLGGQDSAQRLLLGTTRIALEWGVCPYTMAVFHGKPVQLPDTPHIVADRSFFCIKDFRQISTFADRPYVAGYPRMVSYIEIPLTSLSGHILGSYCVVDNKPRDFLHPEALATLREVTSAIGSYLDTKRMEGSRTRSEKMMEGLRQFISSERRPVLGTGSADASQHGTGPFDLGVFGSSLRTSRTVNERNLSEYSPSSVCSSGLIPLTSQTTTMDAPCAIHAPSGTTFIASPRQSLDHALAGAPSSQGPHQRYAQGMSTQVNDLFVASANTVGHAMNLDGLVFFDAVPTLDHRASDVSRQGAACEDDTLTTLLSEYRKDHSVTPCLAHQPRQSLIRRLTAEYPQGHLFVMDEHGIFDCGNDDITGTDQCLRSDSAAHRGWNDLLTCVPNARYAIFLPLWHYQREICFATCLAWVKDTAKTLDSGDVNSLTAFGNTLMAQIFRLEAATNTQTKSNFVSSISHELRSPLHGISATVELIRESVQDSNLLSMVDMIDSCSDTLLDTFDHLLEFSNINSHASNVWSVGNNVQRHPHYNDLSTKEEPIDMRALVEDVVEVASLGHFSSIRMFQGLETETKQRDASLRPEEAFIPENVIVTTDIESNRDWIVPMRKGAWKRILLNILSNAFKYTNSGHVNVALSILEQTDVEPRYISLSVTDTGIGMSHEFLKYHVFTPFVQENDLSPGTGLGLSIVKSIVDSVQGKICIESQPHRGTNVTVSIPFNQERNVMNQAIFSKTSVQQDQLQGISLGLISIIPSETPSTKAALRLTLPPEVLARSVRNICEGQFGMVVTDASINRPLNVEVLAIDTHALISANKFDLTDNAMDFASQTTKRVVVLLGVPAQGIARHFGVEEAICVPSPITGQKIKAGILSALSKAVPLETTSSTPGSSTTGHQVPLQGSTQNALSADRSGASQEKCRNVSIDNQSAQDSSHKIAKATEIVRMPKMPLRGRTSAGSPTLHRFRRLLLVDDNPINLKLLTAFAKRMALSYSTASDGAEAVRLYRKAVLEEAEPFDCIFMDISMPVMDGFQAVTAIRRFEMQQNTMVEETNSDSKEASPAPRAYVLALTGLGSAAAQSSARASGFDEYLLKPVKFKNIAPLLAAKAQI